MGRASRVVGRDREIAAMEDLLGSGEPGASGLLVEGEAGMGKTVLWQAGVASATARDLTLLRCRPAESEAKLAFAALSDLLAPLADAVDDLPEPQRIALDAALLRSGTRSAAHDRRAVGAAVQTLLRRHAAKRTLVLAIDDLQWVDRASSSALLFALRRLHDEPVRVLAAIRIGNGDAPPPPLDLDEAMPGLIDRIRLGPLNLGALHFVTVDGLGRALPRPTLRRVAQASGGNPLFALELARALREADARPGPGEPLAVPGTLAALLRGRIRKLSARAREVVLAAASANASLALLERALGSDVEAALDEAERAGVVAFEGERIVFTHPLLASVAYQSASVRQRQHVYRQLARATTEPEEQARYLALAATEPDEHVAARLERAAHAANGRGAPEVAAELSELAHRLTPAGEAAAAARLVDQVEFLFRAADTTRAEQVMADLLARLPPGPLRARALELHARMLYVAGTAAEAAAACEEALPSVGDDTELRARILATLAAVSWDDFTNARGHAQGALELLGQVPDPDPLVLGHALATYVAGEVYAGNGLPAAAVEQALELERLAPAPHVSDRFSACLGVWHKYEGDFVQAREWLERTYRAVVEEGDDASLPYVIGHLPQLELWTGNWPEAERRAREHLALAEATAQPDQRRQALFNLAYVHAHMGLAEQGRSEAEELLRDAERLDDVWSTANALAALGLLDLSLGDPHAAVAHLQAFLDARERIGSTEPQRPFADLAEALLETGDIDAAERVATVLEERARAAKRVPLVAVAAYAQGLVAAARGDLDAASAALAEALAVHERVPVPFDLARTLIASGKVHRRRGERRLARDDLVRAREMFEELGSPLWAARADAELRRVPIRRGRGAGLTPTERQVAERAAVGMTSAQIGQAMFMSARTVEANLARIYRTLGIRSRAELGARMAQEPRPGDPGHTGGTPAAEAVASDP